MKPKFVNFTEISDERGKLIIAEGSDHINFNPKRIYYIQDVLGSIERGFHAHKALKQVATCIKGSCSIILDDGCSPIESIKLSKPSIGLIIDPMVWHYMKDFSEDCILLLYANEHYDEEDYIRSYEAFKELVKAKIC
tara:strand:+ start:351 stop:761 length:411 start_codon:yes stop_codon:yes gene_type:complete